MARKLLLGLLLACSFFQSKATYVPVAVTGYTADVIANGAGNASASTTNDVDGVNYAFMAPDFNPSGTIFPTQYLPANGLINSAATPGLSYQMAGYSTNNSLRIAGTLTDSLVFTTPQSAGEVYFMATSGSGATTVTATVNFTDNTTQAFTSIAVGDWYGGSNFAMQGLGRVTIATNAIDNNITDPRLYEFQLLITSTNYTKQIRSITFNKTLAAGILNVFGVTINTLCTGAPTAGTSVANVSLTCPNSNFNLSLTGNSTGVGMSYQWQSSATLNGTYTSFGTAATTPSATTSATTSTYYRAAVTCGSNTSYSTPVIVNISSSLPGGTYTINSGAAASTTNFQNFNAAVAALSCGIAGPIIINVVTGATPYNEQISIPVIPGASSTNTITFNGNGNTITYNGTLATAPHTLALNGADYINFNNLNVIGTGTYALVCHLWNQADNNTFTNCTFTAPVNGVSTTQIPFSISGSATSGTTSGISGSYNIVTGCTINSGYYNTYITGASATPATGNQILNSNLRDFYIYGSYNTYSDGSIISGNDISRPLRVTLSSFYGVYTNTGCTNLKIIKNRLHDPYATSTSSTSLAYMIYCLASATSGNEIEISNNAIYNIQSSGTNYGIFLSTYNYYKVYNNSIVLDYASSTAGTTYGIYSTGSSGIDIRNNIVHITRGGTGTKYCLYYSGTKTSNNNDLYMNSAAGTNAIGYFGAAQTTLANWQAANSAAFDQQSVSIDPAFTNVTTGNLLPTATTLNNLGTPLTGITTDILGVTRSTTAPDIGAYEFGAPPCSPLTGLTANPIAATTATLSWTGVTGAAGYEYVLNQTAAAPTVAGTATTAVTYSATSLLPFTTYYMHVRTNCGTGFSGWITISFTTLCAPPVATITASGPVTFCNPGTVTLTANAGTGLTYQWKLGAVNITTATTAAYIANGSGSYTVVTSLGTCTTTSAAVVVNAVTRPDTAVTLSVPSGNICAGSTVTLSAPAVTGNTYQWLLNNAIIAGATTNTYTANASGSYRILVNNGTCADTSGSHIVTMFAMPVATVSPSGSSSFCQGGNLVLAGPASVSGITYQWKLNGANIAGATSNTYTATTAGTYRLVLSNGVCGDTSAATIITVNPLPGATATAFGSTAFCQGNSITLLAGASATTGITYQWLNNNQLVAGATGTSYAATTTGSYRVRATFTATGCADTAATPIVVTVSAPTFATVTQIGTSPICQGSQIRFQSQNVITYGFQWYKDGLPITGATSYFYNATTAGSYYVVVVNGTCTSTSTPRTVVVNALPTSTIIAGSATAFCAGNSVALSSGITTGLTYQWRLNGVAIAGATTASYPAAQSGIYTLLVTNAAGCTAISTGTVVTVSTMPVPTISTIGTPTFCQGNALQLDATPGVNYTYQWLLNNTPITGATAISYSATTTGNYTVMITNGTCVATSAPFAVSVTPAPPAIITPAGPTGFCQGGLVTLNANRATGLTYQWTLNGAPITGATTFQYTAAMSGSYAVDLFDGACPSTSAPVAVTVSSFPAAVITVTNGNELSTGTYAAYQWYRNGMAISGATTQTYTATTDGYYSVVVTDTLGCSATTPVQRITSLSVGTVNGAGSSVSIYPNPTDGLIVVTASVPTDLSVVSIDGKELLRANNAKRLNITQLPQGLYLIRVSDHLTGQLIFLQKIIRK